MTTERELLPDGVRVRTPRCTLVVRRPAPHVALVRVEGFAPEAVAHEIVDARTRIVAEQGKIALFDDLEQLVGYDSSVRIALTDWTRKNRSKIVAHDILTRSQIVTMGVALANLALGGHIRAHTRREAFEAELARAIGSRGGRG